MKKLQYFLMSMAVVLLLGACASDGELKVKLYDGTTERPIEDPGNYKIISFGRKEIPNALVETISDPRVWFGAGISAPSRYLKSLEADEDGLFRIPETPATTEFMVVLNNEKSLVACYIVEWLRPGRWMEHPRKDDLYGRAFYDVTCKDAGIGEGGLREYYRKLFDDMHVSSISTHVKKEYGVKKNYRVIAEDRGKGEKYVAPLYIDGPNPPYSLPCREEFDDKGEIKDFFNLKD